MVAATSKNISSTWFILPFVLLASILVFLSSSYFLQVSSEVSAYVIIDLLITIPLVYFLIVRRTNIPTTTVVPVTILGLVSGYVMLPEEHHYYLDLFKEIGVPILEISVLLFIVYKAKQAYDTFKINDTKYIDFYTVVSKTTKELFPGRLSELLVSEISVIYYGILNWKHPKLHANQFTYHKKSGTPSIFGALLFIVAVETFALHIFVERWSVLAAWILSGLSIYTGFQLLGFARSLSKRPITLSDNELILRYGILNEARIKLSEIESIDFNRKQLDWNDEIRKFSILGELESHNVVIHCTEVQTMKGIYGITKTFTTLALHIDEKDRFKNQVMSLVHQVKSEK
ncbi:MAG: hypothetical protein P1U56_03260 [Saprospiraceae bacterium]|nr:hypothetical protein [Saprospiraceae bacterium]